MAGLIAIAVRAAPKYTDLIESDTCWDHRRDRVLRGGIRPDDASSSLLLEAAGFLAQLDHLPGVCGTCAGQPLWERGVLRASDQSLYLQALGVASAMAAGIKTSPKPPTSANSSAWLRACYAVAAVAYTWTRQLPSDAKCTD